MAMDNIKLPPEIDQWTHKLIADPKSRVFAQLADGYRKIGMLDEAIETAKRGLEIHPAYAIAHNILGRCYLEKKMYALAAEEFQLTIRNDPQNLVAYKMLATCYERQGQTAEALKYYQMVLDLEPGEIEVADAIEKLKAARGISAAPEPEHRAEPVIETIPERPTEPDPSTITLESVQPSAPRANEAVTAVGGDGPAAPEAQAGEAKTEPVIESAPGALVIERAEPAAAEPPAEPLADAAPPATGQATPTLAEIYAQQGHFEQAIEIYQKLVSDNPDNPGYKTKLDELLAKAYPDEMAQTEAKAKQADAPADVPAAPADVPDTMFSKMFSEMEKVAGGKELNIPDNEERKSEPIALAPETPKEELKLEPAPAAEEPAAPPAADAGKTAAPEPVNIGALFASETPSPAGGATDQKSAGGAEEPKKDDAVSSFQSWLNTLQK